MTAQSATETRVPMSKETRDEVLRPLKRGAETWDSFFRRLAEQCEEAAE